MLMWRALAMTASAALADEVDDAHRLALSGRDSYWNCLAAEYPRDGNKGMSGPDFTSLIAGAVRPSGRISGYRWSIICRCNSPMPMRAPT